MKMRISPSAQTAPGRLWSLLPCLLLGAANLLAADKAVTLKLATIAPRDSSYHKSLQLMDQQWRKLSNGAVKLTIFPGGVQGGEADTVGLMQTGNLDASLLTATGLSEIEPAVSALQSMPMAFRSLEEVDYVGEKMRPMLEQRLLAKGYVVIFWTDSGWVRFFTKSPILRPDDLRKLKLFSWAGDTHQFDLWKSGGFSPVALETKDIPQALLSGTISAVDCPPIFANFSRLDVDAGHAKYMLELNWAPLVGAAVVRKHSWERIPAALRGELLKTAAETGKRVKADGRAENEKSVMAMQKRGLVVQKVPPAVDNEWRTLAEKFYPRIRGSFVPADMFDEAQRLLKEYRAK